MKSRKKPRGITLRDDLWDDVVKYACLIKYNNSQFMEACIEAVVEMMNNQEKRRLPLIVKLVDRAISAQEEDELLKDVITIPIHPVDEQGKPIKNESDPVSENQPIT